MIRIPKQTREEVLSLAPELSMKATQEEKEAIAHYQTSVRECNQFIVAKIADNQLLAVIDELAADEALKSATDISRIQQLLGEIKETSIIPADQFFHQQLQMLAIILPKISTVHRILRKLKNRAKKKDGKAEFVKKVEQLLEHLVPKLKAFGKFKFYKNETLVRQLQITFLQKCAYCESSFVHVSPADIEHFRPKAAVKVDEKTGEEKVVELKPGYYWLAADWDNLLLSCIDCNRRRNHDSFLDEDETIPSGKATIFPLADEKHRIRDHDTWRNQQEKLKQEEKSRLLLNPSIDDPEKHIKFIAQWDEDNQLKGVFAAPVAASKKGEKSISIYGLNRANLIWARTREALHLQHDFFALIVSIKSYLRMRKMEEGLTVLQLELGNMPDTAIKTRLKDLTQNLKQDASQNIEKAIEDIEMAIGFILDRLKPDQPYLAMKRDLIKEEIQHWPPMRDMICEKMMTQAHLDKLLHKVSPEGLAQAIATAPITI